MNRTLAASLLNRGPRETSFILPPSWRVDTSDKLPKWAARHYVKRSKCEGSNRQWSSITTTGHFCYIRGSRGYRLDAGRVSTKNAILEILLNLYFSSRTSLVSLPILIILKLFRICQNSAYLALHSWPRTKTWSFSAACENWDFVCLLLFCLFA